MLYLRELRVDSLRVIGANMQKEITIMKIAGYSIVLLLLLFIGFACKKESNHRFCWQLMDPLWNPLNSVCDKTEAEMQASYLNPCTYSKIGDNYCWYIDNSIFIKDRPQDFIDHYQRCFGFTSAVNVACDYC